MNQLIENCLSLKSLLNMNGSPVSIKYCNEISQHFFVGDQVVCQSLQDARYGTEVALSKDNSKCSGGSYFLGLLEFDSKILDFWTSIEKTHENLCSAVNFVRNTPQPPTSISKYITFSPIEKSVITPDLVVFFCNPAQAARLMGLHVFRKGCPSKIYSYTAACAASIGIPMVSGDLHVSFIDNSARYIASFDEDELIISIPAHQIESIASSVKDCIWGTAEAPYSEIEKRLKGSWKLQKLKK